VTEDDQGARSKLLQSQLMQRMRVGCAHLRRQSPLLDAWIQQCGPCKLTVAWDRSLYEALVRAIAHQQLHGRAAEAILGRLCEGFRGNDFPTPKQIARASAEKLRGMGFSAAKTVAIQGIAAAAARGEIPDRAGAEQMSDEEIIERLVKLRGVGRWTVEMLLIFTLGRLDVLPVDDFGVKSGLQQLIGCQTLPKKADFAVHAATWHPYCSIAAWYLWRKADAAKRERI
jgi:DNA-3-methyladenine glycosylase II